MGPWPSQDKAASGNTRKPSILGGESCISGVRIPAGPPYWLLLAKDIKAR